MIKVFRGGDDSDNDDDGSETERNERGEGELSRWGETWQELRKRTPYYIPCLSWAQKYRWREQLLKDVLAGLAVGFILVPQCLAYSGIVGVDPAEGLYSGWMPLVVYTALGTNRFAAAAAGPEGVLALLIGSSLRTFAEQNGIPLTTEAIAPYASMLCVMTGAFTTVLGLLRVGFFDNLTSRAVLTGFVSASACILGLEQLGTLWGVHLEGVHSYQKLASFFEQFTQINPLNFCIGLSCLGFFLLLEHVKSSLSPRWPMLSLIPSALLVLLVGIVCGVTIDLPGYGVPILGELSSGFPVPQAPDVQLGLCTGLILPAVIIALIAFVKAMAVGKFFGTKYSFQISPNRELVALGLSNFVGGWFQSFPITPSLPRAMISDLAGSTSPVTGLVASTVVLFTFLFLMQAFFFLPKATIAAIILFAASKLIELDDIIFLVKIRAWIEAALALVTFLFTFLFGPETGILIALGLSIVMLIKASTSPAVSIMGCVASDPSSTTRYRDLHTFPEAKPLPGVLVMLIDSSLYFWNINLFRSMVMRATTLGSHLAHPTDPSLLVKSVDCIVLDCRNLQRLDPQATQVLIEMIHEYRILGIALSFVLLHPELRLKLMRAAACQHHEGLLSAQSFAQTVDDALFNLGADEQNLRSVSTYQFLS